jgi:hypothetical protein
MLVFQAANSELLVPSVSGGASFSAPAEPPWRVAQVRRRVRNLPYAWRLVGQTRQIPEVRSGTTFDAVVSARSRLSHWSDLARFTKRVADAFKKPGEVPTAAQYQEFLARKCGGMDDFSLISTFAADSKGGVDLAPELGLFGKAVKDKSPASRKLIETALTNLISACHSVGIQVTAGYEVRDDGKGQTKGEFVKFITSSSSNMVDHATRLRDLTLAWKFDGVGFDIEINGIGPVKEGKDLDEWVKKRPSSSDPRAVAEENAARNIRTLYQKLADLLLVANGFVTYATGAFVDPQTGKLQDGVFRFGHTRVQPLGLVRGHPNLLARIMAYDEGFQAGASSQGKGDSLENRHKQILEGVIGAGIHPSGIQLGVKMNSLKDFGMKSGHMTVQQVVDRCTVLRTYRTGLITFSGSSASPEDEVGAFAGYNTALNDGEFARDAFGVPFQAPHSSVSLSLPPITPKP